MLLEHGDRITQHSGQRLTLQHVVARDMAKPREVVLPEGILSNDLNRILNDPTVKVAALLVGGIEPARTMAMRLLDAGKDLVTANKALLAEHGTELLDRKSTRLNSSHVALSRMPSSA